MNRLLALCLAAVALVAAGCGGDDKGDYTNDVREIAQELDESSAGADLRNVNSTKELADALRRAADLLDEAAGDLEDLDPPDEVSDAHGKLTDGARETADAFRRVADQAEGGSQEQVLASLNELLTSGGAKKLEQALTELEDKGYNVRDEEGEQ